MIDKNRIYRASSVAGLIGFLAVCGLAFAAESDATEEEIEVVPVRGGVYMLVGGGVNSTVQIGDEGVLIVDTMQEPMGEKLLAAVRELSQKPIRHILNTSGNPDQVGGNAVIAAAGSTINAGNVAGAIADSTVGAAVVAHENVLTRMSMADPAPPFEGWPTSTYFFTPTKDVFFNGEAVQLIYQPDAVTNGDSFVFFRRSDVISAGAIFDFTRYPFIDVENGGTFAGTLEALNTLIDLTIPEDKQEGGTMVIPARGRLCDESEVVEYRDMLTIIGNYVREMIKEGRSLKQVLEARPTLAYDPRYGAHSGPWTTDDFVETIYREFETSGSTDN